MITPKKCNKSGGQHRKNNKGFSLLEILVAVAILAVIVTPFLMAFLTSTRVNASTKDRQRAKFAATNVMEDIRSVNIDSIIGATDGTAVAEEDGTQYYVYQPTGAKVYVEDNNTYKYVTTQTADGVDFTVEATLDPNYVDATADKEATEYNAERMAHIYGMNSTYDAFYELDASTDLSKLNQLAQLLYGVGDDDTEYLVYSSVNREIILNITENDDKGATVTVQTVYTMPNTRDSGINTVSTEEQQIYSNSDKEKLRGIYLFYNPLYNGSLRQPKETITVVNSSGTDCTVYLIKQLWPTVNTDAAYAYLFKYYKMAHDGYSYAENAYDDTLNKNYLVNVRLKEPGRADDAIPIDKYNVNVLTTIRTNIDYYLMEPDNVTKRLDAYADNTVQNPNLRLWYSNSGDSYAYNKTIDGNSYTAAKMMGLMDLAGGEVSDSVYNVTVRAYKGTGDKKSDSAAWEIQATTQ